MTITLTNRLLNVSVSASKVEIDCAVNLRYPNEKDSYEIFCKLRGLGIRCYHAGRNAPEGPTVAIYNSQGIKIEIV